MNNINKEILQEVFRDCEFNVIPLGENKVPIPGYCWGRWQDERVPAPLMCTWVNRGNGLAMLTGAKPWSSVSGVVVLDADTEEAIELVKKYCPITPLRVRTPRGGIHFFYRHNGVAVSQRIGHRVGGKVIKLDRKADGTYVVCPGMTTIKGTYKPLCPFAPEIIEECPVYEEWIPHEAKANDVCIESEQRENIELDKDVATKLAKKWLRTCRGATGNGAAQNYCFALAMKLIHGFGLDQDVATTLLYEEWGSRSDNVDNLGFSRPWKYKQIADKIKSATTTTYRGVLGDAYREAAGLFLVDDFYELIEKFNAQKDGR